MSSPKDPHTAAVHPIPKASTQARPNFESIITEFQRIVRPGPIKARSESVTTPERMRPRQRHNGAIVKAHSSKHRPQMRRAVRRIRQPPHGRTTTRMMTTAIVRRSGVRAAIPKGNRGAARQFHRDRSRQRPHVGGTQIGKGVLHGLYQFLHERETRIGAVGALGVKAHGRAVRTAIIRFIRKGTSGVPGQTNAKGTHIGFLVHQGAGDKSVRHSCSKSWHAYWSS
jgi:hypothetical protein